MSRGSRQLCGHGGIRSGEKNVVALRIGGYPETVQAMSDAILGGCELELTGLKLPFA